MTVLVRYKPVSGAPHYMVSDLGDVLRVNPVRRLKPWRSGNGYRYVTIRKDGKETKLAVHRMVAFAFLGPPRGNGEMIVVNHKDGNRDNNTVGNLEYMTRAENLDHAMRSGLWGKGAKKKRKLTEEQVVALRRESAEGETNAVLGKRYGVHPGTISTIVLGKTYADVRDPEEVPF